MYGSVPVITKDISVTAWAVWSGLCTFCHWKRKNGQPEFSRAIRNGDPDDPA